MEFNNFTIGGIGFFISVLLYFVLLIFFKKDDVKFRDIFVTIPTKHGITWWTRKSEVYYKESVLKFVHIPLYMLLISWIFLIFGGMFFQ